MRDIKLLLECMDKQLAGFVRNPQKRLGLVERARVCGRGYRFN